MNDYEVRSLGKRLELKAGFLTGEERFSLRIRTDSGTSSWNHRKLLILIGVKGFKEDADTLSDLLMNHEVGHVLHTSRRLIPESLSFPFSLLNILEDARIESRMETNFGPLHEFSYDTYYLKNREDDSVFSNPFNIGILLRWRKWELSTMTEKPETLSHEEYERLLTDWQDTIDRSIEGESTEIVAEHAEGLYRRWQELFDRYDTEEAAVGSIESSLQEFAGTGDDDTGDDGNLEEKAATGNNSDDREIKDIREHFAEKWYDWDMPYVLEQARILRNLLEVKARNEKEYRMSGRRFDPRRIENPPLSPFKREVLSRGMFRMERLLLIEDGSGSMKGEPFRNACHVSYILSLVFPVDIMITTSRSEKPITVPLKHIDILQRYSAWGGAENYKSLETAPSSYSFTLFLTDACVDKSDQEYVRDVLVKITKVGAGYVGEQTQRLEEVFPRNFYSEQLGRDIARMVALFLKRFFTRQFAA